MTQFERNVLKAVAAIQPTAYTVPICEMLPKGRFFAPSTGAVSTTLWRLEEQGFLRAEWGEATPERGGRRKRYYFLTEKGSGALELLEET